MLYPSKPAQIPLNNICFFGDVSPTKGNHFFPALNIWVVVTLPVLANSIWVTTAGQMAMD